MKKIIGFTVVVCLSVILSSCAGTERDEWKEYYANSDNNLSGIESLSNEQRDLVNSLFVDNKTLSDNIKKSTSIGHNQQEICNSIRESREYVNCLKSLMVINRKSADIEIMTANYFAKNEMREQAKEFYRHVITTYPGSAYSEYTKQAEFGLEDLKGK